VFEYFKEKRQRKEKLRKFKDQIKGIFNDWTVEEYTMTKGRYCLWIGNGCANFADYHSTSNFLKAFSKEERKILWEEFENIGTHKRREIFAEFKLDV